ncbi:MAG: sialate O-acetylesterase [Planctomycetota bacterium]|jgi:sialate O-acetylesterase
MSYHILLVATFLVFALTHAASADVSLPTIFGDHMVLQQQTTNAVWGWAEAGERVTVEASWGATASTKANAEGKWKVFLETPKFGTGHALTVRGKNTIKFDNVAIGEVWLCAGQSNMGWAMFMTFDYEANIPAEPTPGLRIYKADRAHWFEPLKDCPSGRWAVSTPEVAKFTSAVSYYFGKKLHDELGVPVGIVVQAYAGTPIEGLMPWEVQKDNPWSQDRKAFYEGRRTNNVPREEALATFEKEWAEYEAATARGEKDGLGRPVKPPIITKPPVMGHQYPANIFNGMIHPIRPYGIRGMIWYQGERNAKNPWTAAGFTSQMQLMIGYYRNSWHALSGGYVPDDFPVYMTQLPSWGLDQTEPVEGDEAPWAVSREAMRQVALEYPNTGIAVAVDTGDKFALHPRNKKPIGLRHAYLALANVYGLDFVATGPMYRDARFNGKGVVIEFDSVGSGLTPGRKGALDAFAIADADRKWHWADAKIQGDTVVVSSPAVPEPVAVRYAWGMNPSQRNLLYNKEGIPASPFRTDDWPLFEKAYGQDTTYDDPKKKSPKGYEAKDWDRPAMTQ